VNNENEIKVDSSSDTINEKSVSVDVHVHLHDDQDQQFDTSDQIIELTPPTFEEEKAELRSMDLDDLMTTEFKGRIVRKDLTKQLKEGANVPVYVLEYLLGMYCSSAEDEQINEGMKNVKKILTENYIRPDEAEKAKSLIREKGTYKIIDKVSLSLIKRKIFMKPV
jgi:ATP-dependent Lon protease